MTDKDHAKDNAQAWLDTIVEYYEAAQADSETVNISGEKFPRDDMDQRIQETPLSVEVRTASWHCPGATDTQPDEFMILLSTGGPACRITGPLDEYMQPESVRLQWQDWGTPWTNCATTADQDEALLWFASQFWYGA